MMSAIMADPDDMEIVFNNLISNAVKYNKVGGKAEISIDSSDNDAILIFSDTGIGITKNDTENLFAEFVRIKNEKTRNISGSGLGLSIVKKVIELYHGTINVDSQLLMLEPYLLSDYPKKQYQLPENHDESSPDVS